MIQKFYKEFEDEFRGSADLIKSRLRVYLPFLEPLKEINPDVRIVDLGCGRGEWLELLGENGFSALGVDIDDEMLATCRENGHSVEKSDALSFLKTLDDECLSVVTAFHL
ncbi:class I SAM-dependent methyltransferase, partial [bacterium]|nr:class I SAM-dependent methyltransferase [bacterium]